MDDEQKYITTFWRVRFDSAEPSLKNANCNIHIYCPNMAVWCSLSMARCVCFGVEDGSDCLESRTPAASR